MKDPQLEDITPDFIANLKYSDITPEQLEQVFALATTLYSPAELQRHLDRDDGISADDVLLELEEALKKFKSEKLA